jgi:hypothetical protein
MRRDNFGGGDRDDFGLDSGARSSFESNNSHNSFDSDSNHRGDLFGGNMDSTVITVCAIVLSMWYVCKIMEKLQIYTYY